VHSPRGLFSFLAYLGGWGAQLDLREVTAAARQQIEDDKGEITDAALAGYIALEFRSLLAGRRWCQGWRLGPA
jgi:hypothetical protein